MFRRTALGILSVVVVFLAILFLSQRGADDRTRTESTIPNSLIAEAAGAAAQPILAPAAQELKSNAIELLRAHSRAVLHLRIASERGELVAGQLSVIALDQLIGSEQENSEARQRRASWSVDTSFKGDLVIIPLDVESKRVRISIAAPGFIHYSSEVDLSPGDNEIDVSLVPAHGIRCVVLEPDGHPASGVEVRLGTWSRTDNMLDSARDPSSSGAVVAVLRTDDKGEVNFSVSLGTPGRLHVIPESPLAQQIIWTVSDGDSVTVQLSRGVPIVGRLTDAITLAPVPDCRVAIYHVDSEGYHLPVAGTISDNEGIYRFEAIDPNLTFVTIYSEKPGYQCGTRHLILEAGDSVKTVDFRLRRAIAGRFRLLTPTGEPIVGLQVRLVRGYGENVPFSFITSEGGDFSVGAYLVEGENYTIEAIIGGISRALGQVTAAGDTEGPICLTTDKVGRVHILKDDAHGPLTAFEFELTNEPQVMVLRCTDLVGPVWLATGRYLATRFSGEQPNSTVDLLVTSSREQRLQFSSAQGRLEFSYSQPDQVLSMAIFNHSNVEIFSASRPGSPEVINLPTGRYYFVTQYLDGRTIDSEVFFLDKGGLVIGAIEDLSPALTTLIGHVEAEPNVLAKLLTAQLRASSGYRSAEAAVSEEGTVVFADVPAGEYQLVVSLPRALLEGAGELVKNVTILPAGGVVHEFIHFTSGEATRVLLGELDREVQRAFVFRGSQCSWIIPSCDGWYPITDPSDVSLTGVVTASSSAITIHGIAPEYGAKRLDISDASFVDARLMLEDGALPASSTAAVSFKGVLLYESPYPITSALTIRYPSLPGFSVRLITAAGEGQQYELPASGGDIAIVRRDESFQKVTIRLPASGVRGSCVVALSCCGIRKVLFESEEIPTKCGNVAHMVFAESSWTASFRREIAAGSLVDIQPEAALRRIRLLKPLDEFGSLRLRTGSDMILVPVAPGQTEIPVRDLPAGVLDVELLDSNERVVAALRAQIPADRVDALQLY